jgi:mannose-6-phosphate isomerase
MGLAIYPVKLSPLYLPHPWAGGLLEGYYCPGPSVPAPPAGIAEVWTTLDDGARQTVVANGPLKGTPLGDLVRQAPQYVVGRRHRASQPFPVCLRILDVGQDQPLLVHPAEDLLADQPSPAPANAKFWYCLTHSPEASIMVGIRPRVTRLQFVQSLNSPGLRDLLQGFPARQGDSFFIPAGQVHSIGTGNLVCELQQRPVPPE